MTSEEYENRLHNIYLTHYKDPISYEDWNNSLQGLSTNYQLQYKDNLWDLSGKWFQNSLYWSKLWVANPDVENPHRIFKDRYLKLNPQAISQIAKSPHGVDLKAQFAGLSLPQTFSKPALSSADFPSSLPHIPLLIFDDTLKLEISDLNRFRPRDKIPIPSYLSDQAPTEDAKIVGSNSYGSFFGVTGETLVLSLSQGASKGSLYTVFERKRRGFFSREQEIKVKAILKITRFIQGSALYEAQVVSALSNISLDNPVFKGSPPSYNINKTKIGRAKGGFIIGSHREELSLLSVGNIIYLDKGSADGLHVEDSFHIIPSPSRKIPFKRPTEKTKTSIGTLKVIHLSQQKATAVILSASDGIYSGDRFTSLVDSIEVEKIEDSQFLEQGQEFFQDLEEKPSGDDFKGNQLLNPNEEEDSTLLDDFDNLESTDNLFDNDFDAEPIKNFRGKNLDKDQKDQMLEEEFKYSIENEDLDQNATVDEALEIEKENLESELNRKKEISLDDANIDDKDLDINDVDTNDLEPINEDEIDKDFTDINIDGIDIDDLEAIGEDELAGTELEEFEEIDVL